MFANMEVMMAPKHLCTTTTTLTYIDAIGVIRYKGHEWPVFDSNKNPSYSVVVLLNTAMLAI